MKHSNLYYLLLADKKRNPLPPQRSGQIRELLTRFYQVIRPPEKKEENFSEK